MISGFGQERKLSEYVHHYEPLTYDASGVHGQHHRHKRSLPEEDHKVSLKKIIYVMAKVYWRLEFTLAPNVEAEVHFSPHLQTLRLEYTLTSKLGANV